VMKIGLKNKYILALDKWTKIVYTNRERRAVNMADVFDVANKELDSWQFQKWLCYAYGVLISSATESQKELLEKGLQQDIEQQKRREA